MESTHNLPQATRGMLDDLPGQQNDAQGDQQPGQYPNGGSAVSAAPAAPQPARWGALPAALRDRPQWVLASHNKRPLTADGLEIGRAHV